MDNYVEEQIKNMCNLPELGDLWKGLDDDLNKVDESKEELLNLLDTKHLDTISTQVTLNQLIQFKFSIALKVIKKMTLKKRISTLQELDSFLLSLYQTASRYGREKDLDPSDRIATKDFHKIMGRIKHLEILQNWLYGVDN